MVQVADAKDRLLTFEEFKSINKKVREDALPMNVGTVAQNLRYDDDVGQISKRFNRAIYGGMSTLGTSKVIHGDRYYNTSGGTQTQIVAYSTFIKKGTDADGTFTNLWTGQTADVHRRSFTYKDIWYCIDGTNNDLAYDGTNAETMGIPTPGAATVTEGAAGVLTGAYYYKISYEIDDYQEGNAGTASSVANPSSEKVELSAIPVSTNGRCTARHIYRTKADAAIYYYLVKISDNTTTTYSDNIADASLDTTRTAPTDYAAPPKAKYGTLHKERVFLFNTANGKSNLEFSDIRSGTSYPDVFPALNVEYIAPDDGDIGTDIIEDNYGQLILFKQNGIYKYNTDTDNPVGWTISDKLSPHGSVAQNVSKAIDGVYFIAKFGEIKKRLMRWNGSRADPVFEELEPVLSAILYNKLTDVKLHYHNGYLYITYNDSSDVDIFNNRVITIDLILKNINIDKKNVAHFWSWLGDGDRGELYTGTSDATGLSYREDTDSFDSRIELKSEIDEGTFNQTESRGTEAAAVLGLDASELTDDIGAQIASSVTDVAEDLTGAVETGWPSGIYTSPIIEINAAGLLFLYWNETKPANTEILFWIRTGDTEAAVAAASWSGSYTTPTGSDISGVTAGRYIQYKCQLYTKAVSTAEDVYISRGASPDDYLVRISTGQGAPSESAIEFIWESGFNDFGFKRLRKRFKQMKIEFERSTASGDLVYSYYLNDSSTKTDVTIDLATYASQGYYIHRFALGTYGVNLKHRVYNSDAESLTIKRLSYIFSVEPFNPSF